MKTEIECSRCAEIQRMADQLRRLGGDTEHGGDVHWRPGSRELWLERRLVEAKEWVERMRSVIRKELSEPVVIGCDGTRCRLVPEAVLKEISSAGVDETIE